ncbi:Uncharacterized protein Rs2_02805 [Raphanus sativus]|nr:Uncharacterized protein Rs2_02805 [Raphanus sativus]
MSQFKSPEELSFNRASCRCDSKPDRVFKPRNGRLVLQCKAKKCPDVELSRELYFPDIACPYCSKPTLLFRSNSERNPGKLYYKCIPCDFPMVAQIHAGKFVCLIILFCLIIHAGKLVCLILFCELVCLSHNHNSRKCVVQCGRDAEEFKRGLNKKDQLVFLRKMEFHLRIFACVSNVLDTLLSELILSFNNLIALLNSNCDYWHSSVNSLTRSNLAVSGVIITPQERFYTCENFVVTRINNYT